VSATVERQDLWISGEGGYHTYRIPALIRTAAGSVLAFCEGRKHSRADAGEIDLLLRRSRDGGRTWEPTLLVATDPGMTCGNPAPVVDGASGTIWLPFCKNPAAGGESAIRAGAAERTVWLTNSVDDGATWAEPVEISATVKRPDWSWYATGPGHGVRLRSGRLLIPCDHRTRRGGAAETLYAHMIYSDDHGATWRIGGLLDLEGGNESIAVETADGAVYFNARDQRKRGHRGVSWSTDGGLTFPPGRWDEALVEPACQGSAVDLPPGSAPDGGSAILFCNPASATRDTLTLRRSPDGGRTWTPGRVLESGPAAYNDLCVVPAADAPGASSGGPAVLCLFERGDASPYERLTLARVPLAWLD
jgi:sialidase-1